MSAHESLAWTEHYPEFVPARLDYEDVTLLDLYERNLETYPQRPATWFFGRSQTFAELDEQVRRAAAGLRALGVSEGDHVALAMPNCPQHIVAFLAILRVGAVAVEHNPLYTARELREPMRAHGARVAIVWDKAADVFQELRAEEDSRLETIVSVNMIQAMPTIMQVALRIPLPKLRDSRHQLHGHAPNTVGFDMLLSDGLGGDGRDLPSPANVTPDSPVLVLFTSGTTGTPKGAQLTHRSLYSNVLQAQAWLDVGADREVMIAALPFFHAYGMTTSLIPSFMLGAEIVIVPSPKVDLILQAMKKRTDLTWITGVPTLWDKLGPAADEAGVSLKNMRYTFSGAASMSPELFNRWKERTGGGVIIEGYGLTECSPIVIGTPVDNPRPGYIGLPFPDTLVRVGDLEDLDKTAPDGEPGELLVKGPQVFAGYLGDDEATEAAFHDGWLRTGDVGVMEPNGFVRLTGRLKETVVTGGFNVYPGEVEEVLAEHGDVEEASVVGRPSKDGGETVVACVVLRDGAKLDPEGLKDFARQSLARYKVPREFYVVDELPTNMLGKVLRKQVREQLLERLNESGESGESDESR